jgi:hypothetical protein
MRVEIVAKLHIPLPVAMLEVAVDLILREGVELRTVDVTWGETEGIEESNSRLSALLSRHAKVVSLL